MEGEKAMDALALTEKLTEARQKQREQSEARVAAGLPARLNPGERARANPTSMRKAIDAQCWHCMGEEPGWRRDVAGCTATGCYLWSWRPGARRNA